MRSFTEKRIEEILADHAIDLLTDNKGKTVAVHNGLSGRHITRHKSYFAAADYFVPIIKDERLTRIVAV